MGFFYDNNTNINYKNINIILDNIQINIIEIKKKKTKIK